MTTDPMTNDPRSARACCTLDRSEAAQGDALPMFHTVPPAGRYPSTIILADGEEVHGNLIVDDLAMTQIHATFQEESGRPGFAGLLVDREHLSELPAGDSTAAAWVKTMARRDDGLWTGWDLTDLGQPLIPTKRFKFRSPVFDLEKVAGTDNEWRPVRLVSVALTNVPHFKQLAASLNRENAATGGGSSMGLIDRLRARLGKPDAKEDEVFDLLDAALTAGDTAKTEVATLQARAKELEQAELNRQADEFVTAHEGKVADKAKLRARFVADPSGTREAFALLKAAPDKPSARQLGRDAQTPGDSAGTQGQDSAQKRKAAIASVKARDNCSNAQAAVRAQRENAGLWQ